MNSEGHAGDEAMSERHCTAREAIEEALKCTTDAREDHSHYCSDCDTYSDEWVQRVVTALPPNELDTLRADLAAVTAARDAAQAEAERWQSLVIAPKGSAELLARAEAAEAEVVRQAQEIALARFAVGHALAGDLSVARKFELQVGGLSDWEKGLGGPGVD